MQRPELRELRDRLQSRNSVVRGMAARVQGVTRAPERAPPQARARLNSGEPGPKPAVHRACELARVEQWREPGPKPAVHRACDRPVLAQQWRHVAALCETVLPVGAACRAIPAGLPVPWL